MSKNNNDQLRKDILEIYECYFDIAARSFRIMNTVGIPKTKEELELFDKCLESYESSMKEINSRYEVLKHYSDKDDFEQRQKIINNME